MDKIELTPEQQTEYEGYLNGFLEKQQNIINTIKKYIKQFENNPINKGYIADLTKALSVMENGMKQDIEEGINGIAKLIKEYPTKGSRPRLGLARGFSEFLNTGEDWQNEILDPVYELEIYFATMGTPPLPEYPFKPEDPIGHFSWKDKDKNKE